jgi:hypothetical protein
VGLGGRFISTRRPFSVRGRGLSRDAGVEGSKSLSKVTPLFGSPTACRSLLLMTPLSGPVPL